MGRRKFRRKTSIVKIHQRCIRSIWLAQNTNLNRKQQSLRLSPRLKLYTALGGHNGFTVSAIHRSFWLHRFFNCLTLGGKRRSLTRFMLSVLWGLEAIFTRDPALILFEFFELYRYPFMAIQVKRGWSTFIKLTFLPWWRQYLILLQWFRSALQTVKAGEAVSVRVFKELVHLFIDPNQSKTLKKRALVVALSTQSRLALHFRWR